MKKLLIALVLVLALAIPALANPFVDVPLNHWAYDAVQTLAAKGCVIGYPDGTFGGNRALTRYEFAQAVARCLAYMEQYVDEAGLATQEDIAMLEKLIQEFADELKNLGVTVEDLKRALGENSQAIKALEDRVALLEKYAEPVKVTGDFTATYTAYFPTDTDKTDAAWEDETNLYIAATINDYTTAGITLSAVNSLGYGDAPNVTADNFWLIYQKDEWFIQAGEIRQNMLGLGLVLGDYQPDDPDDDRDYDLDYEGFYVTYTPEDSDVLWKALGDLNEFYAVRAEWEHVGVMATWMPEGTEFYNVDSDLVVSADVWTDFDDSDVKLTVEGAYAALSGTYGVAGEIEIKASDDATITVDGHYITDGFTPADATTTTTSAFADDEMGFGVGASFILSGDEEGDDSWTLDLSYDWAAAITTGDMVTNEVEGTVTYVPFEAAKGETGVIHGLYDLMDSSFKVYGAYLNYPLDLDSENNEAYFSVRGQYDSANAEITAVGALAYEWIEEKTTLTVEGRYDSVTPAGVQPWSAMAEVAWEMADKTNLTLTYEIGTWEDEYDDNWTGNIVDNAGTLTAELSVSF
jgi:hypothetical protein